jgi:hypothetical protein
MAEPVKEDKFILDATAGFRMMWFNKKHPNCIYLDQRPECEPDIVGDFRDLRQFADETFNLVVFDPPHVFTHSPYGGSNIMADYGYLRADSWRTDLKKGFDELWRVLKTRGVMIVKWGNEHIPSNEVIDLAPTKPLVYQVVKERTRLTKRNRKGRERVQTLWFCFMKIEPEKKEEK